MMTWTSTALEKMLSLSTMKPKPLNGAKLNKWMQPPVRESESEEIFVTNRMPNNSFKPTPKRRGLIQTLCGTRHRDIAPPS
jgi:hypothetical protein